MRFGLCVLLLHLAWVLVLLGGIEMYYSVDDDLILQAAKDKGLRVLDNREKKHVSVLPWLLLGCFGLLLVVLSLLYRGFIG